MGQRAVETGCRGQATPLMSLDRERAHVGRVAIWSPDLRFRSISGATSNLNIPDLDSPDAVPETSPGSISDVTNAPSLTSASTQDTTLSSTPADPLPPPSSHPRVQLSFWPTRLRGRQVDNARILQQQERVVSDRNTYLCRYHHDPSARVRGPTKAALVSRHSQVGRHPSSHHGRA
jgi:hypothetical protein